MGPPHPRLPAARRDGAAAAAGARAAAMGRRARSRGTADCATRSGGASRCCGPSRCGCAGSSTATRSTWKRTSRAMPTSAPGLPLSQALYQTRRRARRRHGDHAADRRERLAPMRWIGANRRVIDVEREALLLVCLALQSHGRAVCGACLLGRRRARGGRARRQALRRALRQRRRPAHRGARAGALHPRRRGDPPCHARC